MSMQDDLILQAVVYLVLIEFVNALLDINTVLVC